MQDTLTVDNTEIAKFEAMASEWWDLEGKFKPLHMLNPCRLDYITSQISTEFKRNLMDSTPLDGLRILDIGCGGGLISEPMARLGGIVTGIDESEKNINVANLHSKKSGLKINYLNTSPENLNNFEKYDVILNLEIVEHVDNVNLYIKSCYKILKKPVIRYTAEDTPVPVAPNLEKNYIPTIEKIVEYSKKLCN